MRLVAFIILVASCINVFDCAKELGTFGRIVRGRDAVIGQFPYGVKLYVEDKRYVTQCGGALIGARWILTAAHCFKDMTFAQVFLGLISDDRVKRIYDVTIYDITVHPGFRNSPLANDIALIKIPRTRLGGIIATVSLPKMTHPQHNYENYFATCCGWGLTSTKGKASNRLQCGRLQILSKKKCRRIGIAEKLICTAISPKLASPCWGDSGAPLVLEKTGELVGIVSYGDKEDCETGNPTAFTRVTSYLNWIKSVSGIYRK